MTPTTANESATQICIHESINLCKQTERETDGIERNHNRNAHQFIAVALSMIMLVVSDCVDPQHEYVKSYCDDLLFYFIKRCKNHNDNVRCNALCTNIDECRITTYGFKIVDQFVVGH